MKNPHTATSIVTTDEMRRLLNGSQEAFVEAAGKEDDESAVALAMVGTILREVDEMEESAESGKVLVTAQDGLTSRLQSLIASGEEGELTLNPLQTGGLEAKFDPSDVFGWARVLWVKLRHLRKHDQKVPARSTPEPFPDAGRVALLGDWGTGLYGAPEMARAIEKEANPYAMLMHLGDVYYAGTDDEIQSRFIDLWPKRGEAINRAINSNHEMYAGGEGYFGLTLPKFGQEGSYFAHQNKHWTLIGLDVAYIDHDIDDRQVEWLKGVLAQAGERKVVLFSHHQLFSQFESQGTKLWSHKGFRAILESKRIFAWYWGHEHRCCIYREPDPRSGILARCIGHGGMPQGRKPTRNLPAAPGLDPAHWRLAASKTDSAQNRIPSALVLEGRNEFIVGEEDKFLPNGYATLTFDGPRLVEEICDPRGAVLYTNTLAE